ncbi:HAMP domain-containing histidine kinase [Clostridium sp. MSJ-8]|uniref:sensor histidine kinase n=1 Tax=Clostridium sp. MSJ-8 TaxID=2841510 RepID=UPI001C0F1066|nr:ATP-binding protein [Clostridium sp. MSJ-8]MBU5487940.1 HAMP domain-containing histidine kinase [Clostridium sp. MSJ-8]
MKNKKSIKKRLLISFLLVIFLSIIVLDVLLIFAVKTYYYDNSEKVLSNQMKTAIAFYNKYFTASTLKENIYDNVDSFWNQTDAEVQVYDKRGNILMDSIGVNDKNIYSDVNKAISGNTARWIGEVSYCDYNVMAISMPIEVNNEIVGVLRYIISLENVDKEIHMIMYVFVGISAIGMFIGAIVSLVIAKSIIKPITELTGVANEMASGNLKVRSIIREDNEIGNLAETLNSMAEELLKKDELKNEFISSVSHELRTPLTSIKGWAITLDDESTDKATLKTGLHIIEKESDRLGNMVEELLDFSRLQRGKVIINKEKTDIRLFIDFLDNLMLQKANNGDINFIISSDLKQKYAYIDINKMKQVIINILDNAFKFTNKGGTIKLHFYNDEDLLKIVVEDNGCGISEEDLPRVKEKFYKGKNAKSKNGIGLSICDELIKLHNGSFLIESKENIGTKVSISIPNERGL